MAEHILFLTGKLAEKRLKRVLAGMTEPGFTFEVRNLGLTVAALMTAEMIGRRLDGVAGFDRVIVPGLCRGDLEALSGRYGVPVVRGSKDLKDLPAYFGQGGRPMDLSGYDVSIFAEIVEAPQVGIEAILTVARRYAADGADVIDIGCLPDTPFPHLEETVRCLKAEGFKVSVDSLQADELLRAGRAGADYLLSLHEETLWVAAEVEAVPILIPEPHGDLDSLCRAIGKMREMGRPFIADSILDPIHFGFYDSLLRYHELRRRWPDIDIMMGIGNLTELTEADTSGINATLFGLISELGVTSVLTTEVSPHARSAVREADVARRIMYAARREQSLPKGLDSSLLTGHARKPWPYSADEIAELAREVKDPSYRVQVSEEGIHVFNRDGMISAQEPFALFPELTRLHEDPPHAFYMGVELAKARIALQLGKRYIQDEELEWGAAVASPDPGQQQQQSEMQHGMKESNRPGTTLAASRQRKRRSKRS